MATGELSNVLQGVGKTWASIGAIVVAMLYAMGFVALHFHFLVLGIKTEVLLIDTGYLAAGGRALLWLTLVTAIVGIPAVLLTRLVRWLIVRGGKILTKGLGWRDSYDAVATVFLLAATYCMSAALTLEDVLRQPATASAAEEATPRGSMFSTVRYLGLSLLSSDSPEKLPWDVLAAVSIAVLTLFGVALAIGRWRRRLRADLLLIVLIVLTSIDFVLLVGVHGVYFIHKRVERLMPAPHSMAGQVEQVWLVHRGASKATLFFCTLGGKRVMATVPINEIDTLALFAPQPIAKIMGVDACVSKSPLR